ncbi:acyltransferase [Butyrivibrio sp. MC2013]|uniref:acyltransferase n=1 Tax=Butyrivibrio sp. MC2013 TaxID=1280686 RepID=UPI0004198D5B|nr:acyltransferase family protein [Butyrivibrio sp. MC2013]
MPDSNKKRLVYPDLLRILSSLAVIMIHVSSQYLAEVEIGSREWLVFRCYRDICSFAVPVFVMISGSLFLGRDISFSDIFRKYIARIMLVFAFWSLVYDLIFVRSEGLMTMAGYFIRGYSHMWFLYMIAGLYLITPFLRRIVIDDRMLGAFIIMGLLLFSLLPDAISILGRINDSAGGYLGSVQENLNVYLFKGFVYYYVLGYYFSHKPLKRSVAIAIYAAGIASFALQIFSFVFAVKWGDGYLGEVLNNTEIIRLSKTAFIFLLFKRTFEDRSADSASFLPLMGTLSFGAYLIHQMVITLLNKGFGLNSLSFETAFSVPAISVLVFVLSYLCIYALRKIRVFRHLC